MGFWDNVLSRANGLLRVYSPRITYVGTPWVDDLMGGLTPVNLWRTQPHLRTVVSFRCENVSQLGVHLYKRETDGGRTRTYDSPAALTLKYVDGQMTTQELMYSLVGDLDLYDRAYWWITVADDDHPAPYKIRRLPPAWVSEGSSDVWGVASWLVGTDKGTIEVPAKDVLEFRGYDPSHTRGHSPAIEALQGTLREQIEAMTYRSQVWKNGGRVSGFLSRPAGAPAWSENARTQFREDWYSKFTGRGPKAGGAPILEDGMTFNKVDFNAQEQQFVEASKLSFQTVCGVYHINPSMVGQTEGTSGRSVREYRKALYGDNLGPLLARITSRINTFLLPKISGGEDEYFEFNLLEKISGDFIEEGQLLSLSVGGPWMTRNEARFKRNMPAIEGGDELIVPLNVTEGGQANPADSGSQNLDPNAEEPGQDTSKSQPYGWRPVLGVKKRKGREDEKDALVEEHEKVLAKFFRRQGDVVRSRLGAKSPDWWDEDRWNKELTEDLRELHALAIQTGASWVSKNFDPEQVQNYLETMARNNAEKVNSTTLEALQKALEDSQDDEDVDRDEAIGQVFTEAQESRGAMLATSAVTFAVAFGQKEAGRQTGAVTKTWIVTSSNPRVSHAVMDGETVGIDETFSNGADVPGGLGDPDNYGCQCEMTINYP